MPRRSKNVAACQRTWEHSIQIQVHIMNFKCVNVSWISHQMQSNLWLKSYAKGIFRNLINTMVLESPLSNAITSKRSLVPFVSHINLDNHFVINFWHNTNTWTETVSIFAGNSVSLCRILISRPILFSHLRYALFLWMGGSHGIGQGVGVVVHIPRLACISPVIYETYHLKLVKYFLNCH